MWARDVLQHAHGVDTELTVILRWRASRLAQRALTALEIPFICTDGEVEGLKVEIEFDRQVYDESGFEIDLPHVHGKKNEKLFVARRGARTLRNEDDVWQMLRGRGFSRVYFETLPIPEQWTLMKHASDIVAVHGAALGALAFNRSGADSLGSPDGGIRVVELFGAGYIVNCYRELVALKRGRWAAVRGPISSAIVRDLDERGKARSHVNEPFAVDLSLLDEALAWVNS